MRPLCVYHDLISILTNVIPHARESGDCISIKLNCDYVIVCIYMHICFGFFWGGGCLFCLFVFFFFICDPLRCLSGDPLTVVDRHKRNIQFLVALYLFRNPFYLFVKPDFMFPRANI